MKIERRGDNELIIAPETDFESDWLESKARSAFIKAFLKYDGISTGDIPVLKIEFNPKYVTPEDFNEQSSRKNPA
jgi:hypothetical protein